MNRFGLSRIKHLSTLLGTYRAQMAIDQVSEIERTIELAEG